MSMKGLNFPSWHIEDIFPNLDVSHSLCPALRDWQLEMLRYWGYAMEKA